ncbi:hemolysin XhlA family protein [Cytobacillus firmus]|uniref:phage minor capsid protein n=1 Tax=Cytobacillus firmus TaxID=1399 RepID=UPI00237AB525|nr:phage minor capsid protein [Cytobacillus firmus]MDD9313063.1 hemolysin XhlA family protein [Cytobacillus firmus]MED1940302.1 hemolysin XhlA family protein [Cytobacillus firmus]
MRTHDLHLEEAGYEAITESEMELIEAVTQGILLQPPLPKESPVLEGVLLSFQRQARETFNLINTTMLDQSQQIYLTILNETTGKVIAGTKTPRQALAETAARWAEHGVPALIRKDGAKMSTEAYVSMVTRSMSNSVANEMQFARMDEYGADLVEVSSHMGARPKCAKFQGKIFKAVSVNAYNQEIAELKGDIKDIEFRVNKLERVTDRHDQQITSINEKLNKIDENTTWIKRTITGAIITAICTGIIGGAIAIFYNVLRGGQ